MSAVLIMARAPRAGATKTRLEPMLGPHGCARLQAELIRHTVTWANRSGRDVWLAHTPPDSRDEISQLVPPTVHMFPQGEGDLGARLREATQRVFRTGASAVTVIGTDAPQLGQAHLYAAEKALAARNDACLVPALDGGYALISLSRPLLRAFDLPPEAWGGPDVLALTFKAIADHGRVACTLDSVRDLDVPADAIALLGDPDLPEPIRRALGVALVTA
ncbi:MAG TPA: TIGR04282 family arsenosugar biosynthesis glycosyltransferase [Gaiellaceae bacterium]|nr:TIGR04282 family arsenosugar biosynthesis glycosyltransferase [Gaiellaceae bacterium]